MQSGRLCKMKIRLQINVHTLCKRLAIKKPSKTEREKKNPINVVSLNL